MKNETIINGVLHYWTGDQWLPYSASELSAMYLEKAQDVMAFQTIAAQKSEAFA